MTSILYDYLTRPELRAAIAEEHATLAGLLDRYHEELKAAYATEIGSPISQR
jgi:hypothetical protein